MFPIYGETYSDDTQTGIDDELSRKARQEAVKLVRSWLNTPDQQSRITLHRQNYERRRDQIIQSLSSAVRAHAEEVRLALELLSKGGEKLGNIRTQAYEIDVVCERIQKLIPRSDLVFKVNTALNNLDYTTRMIRSLENMSRRASQLHDLMTSYDHSIVVVYKEVRLQKRLQHKAEEQCDSSFLSQLRGQCRSVDVFFNEFEKCIWFNVDEALLLSEDDPTTLVKTLQVVEMETNSANKIFNLGDFKSLTDRVYDVLKASIKSTFKTFIMTEEEQRLEKQQQMQETKRKKFEENQKLEEAKKKQNMLLQQEKNKKELERVQQQEERKRKELRQKELAKRSRAITYDSSDSGSDKGGRWNKRNNFSDDSRSDSESESDSDSDYGGRKNTNVRKSAFSQPAAQGRRGFGSSSESESASDSDSASEYTEVTATESDSEEVVQKKKPVAPKKKKGIWSDSEDSDSGFGDSDSDDYKVEAGFANTTKKKKMKLVKKKKAPKAKTEKKPKAAPAPPRAMHVDVPRSSILVTTRANDKESDSESDGGLGSLRIVEDEEVDDKTSTESLLKDLKELFEDLPRVDKKMSKCFPARYGILEFYVNQYYMHFLHCLQLRFLNRSLLKSELRMLLQTLLDHLDSKYLLLWKSKQSLADIMYDSAKDFAMITWNSLSSITEKTVLQLEKAKVDIDSQGRVRVDGALDVLDVLNQQVLVSQADKLRGVPMFFLGEMILEVVSEMYTRLEYTLTSFYCELDKTKKKDDAGVEIVHDEDISALDQHAKDPVGSYRFVFQQDVLRNEFYAIAMLNQGKVWQAQALKLGMLIAGIIAPSEFADIEVVPGEETNVPAGALRASLHTRFKTVANQFENITDQSRDVFIAMTAHRAKAQVDGLFKDGWKDGITMKPFCMALGAAIDMADRCTNGDEAFAENLYAVVCAYVYQYVRALVKKNPNLTEDVRRRIGDDRVELVTYLYPYRDTGVDFQIVIDELAKIALVLDLMETNPDLLSVFFQQIKHAFPTTGASVLEGILSMQNVSRSLKTDMIEEFNSSFAEDVTLSSSTGYQQCRRVHAAIDKKWEPTNQAKSSGVTGKFMSMFKTSKTSTHHPTAGSAMAGKEPEKNNKVIKKANAKEEVISLDDFFD